MLRTLEAIRLETVLVGGRTRPLVVECRTPPSDSEEEPDSDFSDETKLMVVKAKGLPEVKEQNLFCELVGNVIAREVGIVTPHPAFINLSQPFVNSINPIVREHNIQLQTGVGVGCEYLRPLRQIIPTSHFSLEELEQAALIYGFDLLTQNSDRRIGKPNSALHNDQIVAFDFELCFSFLLPIIGQKSPWMVSQHGINSRHIFRSMLKRTTPDWSPFIEAVRNLAQNRLDVIQGMMPESWQLWGQQVQEHIKHVIMNIDQFEIELQRSLL